MDEKNFNLEAELKKLPDKPGVYLMHGAYDEIIYVGKAVVLKNRVRQYFQSGRGKTAKILEMVRQIRRFEYIVTDSEAEALVLECNLIKEHQPRYNTLLKDGKGYPYIRIDVASDFPKVTSAHQMKKDKAKYFGPYPSQGAVKETLELLHKMLHLRTCNQAIHAGDIPSCPRPCLNYQMKLCDAPCQGFINKEEYQKKITMVSSLLNGHDELITKDLELKMQQASELLDFEKAMEYRDLIQSVKYVAKKQKLSDTNQEDRDVIGICRINLDAVVQIMFFREGRMIGREHFHLQVAPEEEDAETLGSFLLQYYAGTPFIPSQIYLPYHVEEEEWLGSFLSSRRDGKKVNIVVPQKGEKEHLVEMATTNARIVLEKDRERLVKEEQRTLGAMRQLRLALGFDTELHRIESFDISNTGGFLGVGSMIVFEDGRPKKSDYRKFRMKWVKGMNDYACMDEILTRRFTRALNESEGFERLPDVILMDGGKGQIHIAEEVLEKLGLSNIPVCGMVKDDHHRTRGLYYREQLIDLDTHGDVFQLVTRVQDETHRFAIEYHRSLRNKAQTHSILDDIPKIGPKRRKSLMMHFENLEQLRDASLEELKDLPGMDQASAQAVVDFFAEQALHSGEQTEGK